MTENTGLLGGIGGIFGDNSELLFFFLLLIVLFGGFGTGRY